METNNKAIDEIWYKRAVDYYHQESESYVYSVPFDAGKYAEVNRHERLVQLLRSRDVYNLKYELAITYLLFVNKIR